MNLTEQNRRLREGLATNREKLAYANERTAMLRDDLDKALNQLEAEKELRRLDALNAGFDPLPALESKDGELKPVDYLLGGAALSLVFCAFVSLGAVYAWV